MPYILEYSAKFYAQNRDTHYKRYIFEQLKNLALSVTCCTIQRYFLRVAKFMQYIFRCCTRHAVGLYTCIYSIPVSIFFFTLTFQELSQLNQRNGNQCSGLSLIIVTEKIVVKVWWNDFMELKMLYNWKFCLSLLIILMAIKDYLYIMWFPQSYKKNVSNKQKIQQQTTKHPRLMP